MEIAAFSSENWRKFNRYNNNGNGNYEPLVGMGNYQDRWLNQGLQAAVIDFLAGNLSSPPEVVSNDGGIDTEPASFLYADLFKSRFCRLSHCPNAGLGLY